MMTRDTQIEVMRRDEERVQGFMARWLAKPEYVAALHAHDHELRPTDKRAVGGR